MHRAVLLSVCLAAACSGEQRKNAVHAAAQKKTNTSKSPTPGSGRTNPSPAVAPARRGYNPPRLHVNDRGVHFEIFELDDLPYDGKIVTYHNEEQKIIATEKIFEKGRLNTEREYWPNAKPKLDITHGLGNITTNRYDQQGNEIKPTPAITNNNPPPRTRALNWTYNYNGGNTRLEAFLRQNTTVLVNFLGEPDSKLNNVWIYRNMRITDARTRRKHTAVRFNVSGDGVSSVVLLQ